MSNQFVCATPTRTRPFMCFSQGTDLPSRLHESGWQKSLRVKTEDFTTTVRRRNYSILNSIFYLSMSIICLSISIVKPL